MLYIEVYIALSFHFINVNKKSIQLLTQRLKLEIIYKYKARYTESMRVLTRTPHTPVAPINISPNATRLLAHSHIEERNESGFGIVVSAYRGAAKYAQ